MVSVNISKSVYILSLFSVISSITSLLLYQVLKYSIRWVPLIPLTFSLIISFLFTQI